jgi:hypothetical protein
MSEDSSLENPSMDWRDKKYREVYEEELRGLERRLESSKDCTIAEITEIEGTLKHLYIMEGSDWAGRGELQSAGLEAAIAAHEEIIARMKGKNGKKTL